MYIKGQTIQLPKERGQKDTILIYKQNMKGLVTRTIQTMGMDSCAP